MPDSLLRQKLTTLGFGSCIIGDSINGSCSIVANATYLDVSNYNISELTGIEAFSSLKKLNCSLNNASSFTINALPQSLDTLIANGSYFGHMHISSVPANLVYLSITYGTLSSLPSLPNSLRYLDCSQNFLSSFPFLPDSLRYLYCNSCYLVSLPVLPQNLLVLHCEYNSLTSLPVLPSNLINLNCYGNTRLQTLPYLPASLLFLDCSFDSLFNLPALPSYLKSLSCQQNNLLSLPALPSSLYELYCGYNHLTSLPSLPPLLRSLWCSNNSILTIPSLPSSLTDFQCQHNNISTLPALPSNLSNLDAGYNLLSLLPALPNSLSFIICDNNSLQSLPALPPLLVSLSCKYNQISSIPTLGPLLWNLQVDYNNLSGLPELKDSMGFVTCSYNNNLSCLPQLKRIINLNFLNCPVMCLPNYGNVTNSYPSLSSVPLCDVFNSSGCNFFWNISGRSYLDANNDCFFDFGESGIKNNHINLYENGNLIQQVYTGGEGFYSFDVNNFSNYIVEMDTAHLPFTSICPSSNNYLDTISANDSTVYNNDFAIKCRNGFDVGVWSIVSTNLRPTHLSTVSIHAGDLANFYGVHCASGISGDLTITINGNAHYYSPVPGSTAPTSVNGNVITFHITDFGNSGSYFAFILETDTLATSGSQICFDAFVTPTINDNNNFNNSLSTCVTVSASLDPNDKEVYPKDIIDTSQHELTYTIRFQNTGNANAENIYILDTLDNNLDLSTFQLLSTSHKSFVQILDGGIAKFNFPDINLPDSFANEPLSHGYVQYKISLKNGLSIGTQIHNTAYIYFDFNVPVVTNTTSNTIDLNNAILPIENTRLVKVYPLPFSKEFTIEGEIISSPFSIVDIYGREMINGIMKDVRAHLNTENWTNGIYFLRIENKHGVIVKKLIKK